MIDEYIAAGVVTDSGVLSITSESRAALARAMRKFKRGAVDVIVRPQFHKRSSRANRYYHGCVLKRIVDATQNDKDAVHDDMCDRFIEPQTVSYVNKETGEVDERTVPGRSSRLDVSAFYAFVENVRQWAAEWLDLDIPDPDPAWRELDEADERKARRKKVA